MRLMIRHSQHQALKTIPYREMSQYLFGFCDINDRNAVIPVIFLWHFLDDETAVWIFGLSSCFGNCTESSFGYIARLGECAEAVGS
jgi:hypothetical protein